MKYDLVFEGGGAKGIVFVGALRAFEEHGNTHGRLLGTSAGAITASLVAAGYGSQELQAALSEKQDGESVFEGFMGFPAPFTRNDLKGNDLFILLQDINIHLVPKSIEKNFDEHLIDWLAKQPADRHIFSFIQRGGWYSADNFLDWLKVRMDTGTFNNHPRNFSRMSLEEFYAVTKNDLSVVAADTTGQMMLVLNHLTAPACPLVWAVRMSMSIPLLWQEITWQPEWGEYRGQDITSHTIVDGGLLSCFPLELFLSKLKDVTDVMGEKKTDPVLGLLIDQSLPVPGTESPSAQGTGSGLTELQTVRRITGLLDTAISAHDKMVEEAYEKIIVHLPAKGYRTTEFNMSDQRRDLLVAAGQQAMANYLSRAESGELDLDEAEAARLTKASDRIAIKLLNTSQKL